MNFLLPKKILCYLKNGTILKRSLDGFRKVSNKYKKRMSWPKLKRGLVEFSTFKENSWALEKFWSLMFFDGCSNLTLASDLVLTFSFTKRKLVFMTQICFLRKRNEKLSYLRDFEWTLSSAPIHVLRASFWLLSFKRNVNTHRTRKYWVCFLPVTWCLPSSRKN